MRKVPPVRAPKKVLQKQQGTLQKLHRASTGRKSTQLWGDYLPLLQRTPQDRRQKISGEYTIKVTIRNKMRLDKCDACTAKETLWYKR